MPKKGQLLQTCQDILICFHAERLDKLPLNILFPPCHHKVTIHCANSTHLVAENFIKSDKASRMYMLNLTVVVIYELRLSVAESIRIERWSHIG